MLTWKLSAFGRFPFLVERKRGIWFAFWCFGRLLSMVEGDVMSCEVGMAGLLGVLLLEIGWKITIESHLSN